MRRRAVAVALVVAAGGWWASAHAEPRPDPVALERRVRELERQNAELLRRLERLEQSASPAVATEAAGAEPRAAVAGTAEEAPRTVEAVPVEIAARPRFPLGEVRGSFRLFTDSGFGYRNPPEDDVAESSFVAGTIDLFATAQMGERFQALGEVVLEGDSADNEFGIDVERLWGQWTLNDALYLKLGREHSPQNRWNRRYHHGKWLWTSATQPFLARFEDDGGPLMIHQVGLEAGGRLQTGVGALEYVGAVSNGRGRTPTEVQNFGDRNENKALDAGLGFSPTFLRGLGVGADFHADEIPTEPGVAARRHAIGELVESVYVEHFAGALETLGEFAWIQHDDRTSNQTFHHRTGYLQLGYRLGAFMPFTRFDVRDMAAGDPFYAPDDIDLDGWEQMLGIRYDVTDYLAVKLEGAGGREQRRSASGELRRGGFGRLAAQLALVF